MLREHSFDLFGLISAEDGKYTDLLFHRFVPISKLFQLSLFVDQFLKEKKKCNSSNHISYL